MIKISKIKNNVTFSYPSMRIKISFSILFLFFLFAQSLKAELLPKEKSTINYTTVYFEESFKLNAAQYELHVYSDSLGLNLIHKKRNAYPAFWLNELSWATTYYWNVEAFDSLHNSVSVCSLHQFKIMPIRYQSYDEIRIDVIKNLTEKHSGGVISLDYTRSIMNREGKLVWTIPEVDQLEVKNTHIRDLRITRDNTITFLTFRVPYEIDFNGKLLWKAPFPCIFQNDTLVYHHDFKKTNRGTYMVLAERKVNRRLLGEYDDEKFKKEPEALKINDLNYKRILVTVLLEFDKLGKVIWYWDANEYVDDLDFNYKKNPDGISNFATHANAFSENEEGTKVYVGFRDLSRIVKIDKKSKIVEQSYGERYPSGEARVIVPLNNQHDANVTNHNSIYVFNNNGFKTAEGISTIYELKDNLRAKENPILWKFDLNFDELSKGKSVNGGDIVELSPTNLLFCAGALNRVFEITKSKEIVWDAFLFSRGVHDTTWQPFVQYRANWVRQLNWFYFLVRETPPSTLSPNKSVGNIELINSGNCEDHYNIQVLTISGDVIKSFNNLRLSAGESMLLPINLSKRQQKKGNLQIRIESKGSKEVKMLKG